MRGSVVAFVAACLVSCLGGCVSRDAIGSWQLGFGRGTLIDVAASAVLPPVETRAMRVLRAQATQVAVIRLAEELPARSNVRSAFAAGVMRTNDRLGDVLYCLYGGVRQTDASGLVFEPTTSVNRPPCFFFDSLMLEYSRSIIDLVRQLGEIESVRNLNRHLTRAIAGSSIGALVGSTVGPAGTATGAVAGLTLNQTLDVLADLLADLLHSGRTISALYRDILTLEMYVFLDSGGTRARPAQVPLGLRAGGITIDRALLEQAYAMNGEPVPQIRHFAQLAVLQLQACAFVTEDAAVRDVCGRAPQPVFGACWRKIDQNGREGYALRPECLVGGPRS